MNQHSMDLSVTLKGPTQSLHLKNPVLTASGTFGYGMEFAPYGDLTSLGGIIVKGLSLLPRDGNPCPRIVETTAGMLNAVGLQNDGVEAFCKEKLPRLPWQHLPVIANLYAPSPAEFGELAARLDAEEGVAALEVNVSCPNVKSGGILFKRESNVGFAEHICKFCDFIIRYFQKECVHYAFGKIIFKRRTVVLPFFFQLSFVSAFFFGTVDKIEIEAQTVIPIASVHKRQTVLSYGYLPAVFYGFKKRIKYCAT